MDRSKHKPKTNEMQLNSKTKHKVASYKTKQLAKDVTCVCVFVLRKPQKGNKSYYQVIYSCKQRQPETTK